MNIAKYIGLFLVKNEYCFLPGIGNLKVVKESAKYDKDSGNILSPEYTVVYEQGHGAIDDAFANFIATNERISIIHASNYLSAFCHEMKQSLLNGEEVTIPGIGKFKMENEKDINFEKDPHLNVKGKSIPLFKSSPAVEKSKEDNLTQIIENTEIKEPKGNEEIVIKPPTVNWTKIIILGLVALGIIAVIIYFANNLIRTKALENATNQTETVRPDTIPIQQKPVAVSTKADSNTTAPSQKTDSFMVAVNQYKSFAEAKKRMGQLNSFGNKAVVWTTDSVTFFVVIKVNAAINEQKAIDSLKRFFNPSGKVEIVGQ